MCLQLVGRTLRLALPLVHIRQHSIGAERAGVAGEERLRYRELAQMVTEAAGLTRIAVKVDLRLVRPVRTVTMGWWRRPPVTKFFLNRFTIPDVAPFDSITHTFGFRPERLVDHLAYLRRPGLRWRLFRLSHASAVDAPQGA